VKNANPVLVLALLAVWAALAGCGRGEAVQAAPPAPKGPTEYFPVGLGGRTVRLQLAVHLPEMQRGLMERRDLGPDDGMIFVYERPQRLSFWMRNTPTPLDIGFFRADGSLAEVYPLHPFDETRVASRAEDLQFAVELNQGWFRSNGVRPGSRLDLDAVRAALRARGFEPRRYGL
jgi:uncharacterized membrane protein (UPF0127 family)